MKNRRAAVYAAILCFPLAIATSASAECAWVLWGQYTRESDMQEAYVLSEAFEGKSDCNQAADKKNAIEDKKYGPGGVRVTPYAKGRSFRRILALLSGHSRPTRAEGGQSLNVDLDHSHQFSQTEPWSRLL